ncbi:MAG TPA: CoA transferase [Thermomicrobiaceae bacterium]|nr:CoA transferase [Thermomicrobiaceae bacterium]
MAVQPGRLGALDGIRVLEMGSLIAGPFATRIMADLGADVIKVEPPGKGDPLREWGELSDEGSLWFAVQGRNKRSVTLDLRTAAGQALARRLAHECDVLVENFRPGALERWGLGPERLLDDNPGLVMVRISGFGQTGPYSARPGFGNVAECMGGLRYITGFPDRPPLRVGISLADHIAALYAVIGALAALQDRQVTGRGQVVDVALSESVFSLLQDALPQYARTGRVQERSGNDLPFAAPSNSYQTADGVWMAISGNGDSIFVRLMRAIGREDLATDPALSDNLGRVARVRELDDAIAAWAGEHTAAEVSAALETAEVPFGPVYSIADIASDPQFLAREMVLGVGDPRFGEVVMPGVLPVFSATPGSVRWPGPEVGEHTGEVLRDLLELTDDEIARLRERGDI